MKYLALIALVALFAGAHAVPRGRRDLRDIVLQNAHTVEKSLELTIKALRETNRTKEADFLVSEEKKIKTLSAELVAVDHDNLRKLRELENKLGPLEADVHAQLQTLERSPELMRQLIIDNYRNLSETVEEKIKDLEQQDHKGFAEDLKGQLKKIRPLVEKVKVATKRNEIMRLDEEFRHLHQRLESDLDILRLDLPTYQRVLNSTQIVLADVEHVVGELKARNMTDEIETLKVDVAELLLVRDEFKREKSIQTFDYLKVKLFQLGKSLYKKQKEIEKNLRSSNERTRREAPDDVLENSAKLLNAARQAIEKLKAEGKHELAAGLEKIEKVLIDIDSQVRNLHPHTALGRAALEGLEGLLSKAEDALEAELKRLGMNN